MSEQVPVSMIHPEAPDYLVAAALYSAPIDLEAAAQRIRLLWNEDPSFVWDEAPEGRMLRFTLRNVLVLLTPTARTMEVDKGRLPDHSFHVAITCFAPSDVSRLPDATPLEGVAGLPAELLRRRRILDAHVVLTELADCLMREDAAIGLFRPELGVVQPPAMVTELADTLSKGQVPLPLWIGIRTFHPALTYGRTLGLNLFGHLDLEVADSLRTEEEVYSMLANIADYVIASDAYIMPGQSVGYRDGQELPVTQATSRSDGSTVLQIGY